MLIKWLAKKLLNAYSNTMINTLIMREIRSIFRNMFMATKKLNMKKHIYREVSLAVTASEAVLMVRSTFKS